MIRRRMPIRPSKLSCKNPNKGCGHIYSKPTTPHSAVSGGHTGAALEGMAGSRSRAMALIA